MSKKSKKEKLEKAKKAPKSKVLNVKIDNLYETATVIQRINPYMKDRSVAQIAESMQETIWRIAKESNSSYVTTGGWTAIFDDWENGTIYADLYVDAGMAYNSLFSARLARRPGSPARRL
jgi:vacuolar-type H+-ATPase subunit E/Vma4